MSAQQWHRVIDVSVNGFFNATQPLLLPMIRTRWGRIVTVSSVAALIGNKGQVNYAAAKGALHSATKALALEVATRGITVNAVAPGIIGTPMTEGLFDAKAIERLVPMNRMGLPEEVAGSVSFLSSADAAYVTGQIIFGERRHGPEPLTTKETRWGKHDVEAARLGTAAGLANRAACAAALALTPGLAARMRRRSPAPPRSTPWGCSPPVPRARASGLAGTAAHPGLGSAAG